MLFILLIARVVWIERKQKISQLFKNFGTIDLGIHSHDNMDKAMENAITALNNGVNWVRLYSIRNGKRTRKYKN